MNENTENTPETDVLKAISYARVSTGAQAASGLGTDAQHRAVDRAAAAHGWQIVERITDDAVSGKTPTERRPLPQAALEQLNDGHLQVLAVARSDRLARSTIELLRLYERSQAEGWTLAVLDFPAGLSGPEGRMCIGFRALVAEFEADMARIRTTEALEIARLRGTRFGRPSRHSETTKQLASRLRSAGHSLAQIAAALTDADIATPTGNTTWTRSSARSLLRTINHDAAAQANAQAHQQALTHPDNDGDPPSQHSA
ncbi:recombinase family protein [Candidatus Poriferisodalis sp.]|uniref:recombinase family protein n=1 Tax=Candidatus Poriferisodalis sp. TaxID=3101277 RepID=UPI003B02AC65